MPFEKIDIQSLQLNPFSAIGKQWMLIVAGTPDRHNAMTASWGSLGELWGHPSSTIHIRPQRYTKSFVEEQEYYSICFFDEQYRSALSFFGTKSGRDFDKPRECGFTPAFDEAAPYYEEASLVFICRKLFAQDMTEQCFLDKGLLEKWYPQRDLHCTYVGQIVTVLKNI